MNIRPNQIEQITLASAPRRSAEAPAAQMRVNDNPRGWARMTRMQQTCNSGPSNGGNARCPMEGPTAQFRRNRGSGATDLKPRPMRLSQKRTVFMASVTFVQSLIAAKALTRKAPTGPLVFDCDERQIGEAIGRLVAEEGDDILDCTIVAGPE